ncbi:lipopolysaccharide cholinephosphotransferase LicD-like [Acropora millepora]|uniref:lipopolysaccharide cholinephosphotransferase LicD-like n=1 Tax=Acropora millepora TaxID=45264 RepID=UPI0010FC66F4|nr:lipopolysaccharide cholinephosphotransferase LicD-like [Acropora millepora]
MHQFKMADSCDLWCKKRNKRTITLVLALITVFVLIFTQRSREPQAPELAHFKVEKFMLKQIPYTNLSMCERRVNAEFNCPDIRRQGKTLLRQAQLVLTRLLKIFDLIAKKHGITYWLYRGTLLGAVRHEGHNPFDNDVDIALPKSEFEKFVKYGVTELPKDIFFQAEGTDVWKPIPSFGLLGKLRDKSSCYKYCFEHGCKHKDGLQLDLFVIENDDQGNLLEVFSHTKTNWIVQRLIYNGIILRKPDEYIFPLIQVKFDGFLLPVPREWKMILHTLYGDFMTVPENEPLGHIITDTFHSCDEVN